MADTTEGTLRLTLLSPERQLVRDCLVSEVTLTGSEGQIQILPGHADMIGTLETGVFSYRETSGETETGAISAGFFEVRGGTVTVTAETAEFKAEIDLHRARKAQLEAEEMLKAADLEPAHFHEHQARLERALIRQHVANSTEI